MVEHSSLAPRRSGDDIVTSTPDSGKPPESANHTTPVARLRVQRARERSLEARLQPPQALTQPPEQGALAEVGLVGARALALEARVKLLGG